MDTTQLLLISILTISTIFTVIIGIQLFFVLIELRKTLTTVNKAIRGLESIGLGVEHGFSEIVGFFQGLKTIFKAVDIFAHKKDDESKTRK